MFCFVLYLKPPVLPAIDLLFLTLHVLRVITPQASLKGSNSEMEIVDQEIEKVLPCFRAAVHCELLSEPEVKRILLQRKKDEAKLIKREADLRDFINFVHRDNMILKLIAKVNVQFLMLHICF